MTLTERMPLMESAAARPALWLDADADVTLEEFFAVCEGERQLELTARSWDAVGRSREVLDELIADRRRIYGITTGYGPLATQHICPEQASLLQRNLVYHLASGVGQYLSAEDTRALLGARLIALSRGHSAIRPETLELLLNCLRHDILPLVPAMGTVGASGDLTPLAHLALGWLGEGEVRFRGRICPAAEALAACGLKPWVPDAKEGLAMVNGTSAMTGIAARNAVRARRASHWALALSALHGEVAGVRSEAWHPRLGGLRPHPGQLYCHEFLHGWIESSERAVGWAPPPRIAEPEPGAGGVAANQEILQDPYTLRCVPQILGAVVDVIDFHHRVVETELNAVTDNPVFFSEDASVYHGGNFYGQHVAFASDALHNAIVKMAILAERTIARVTDVSLNRGLPAFLQGDRSGLQSGYMGAQVTASAVLAEMRSEAMPASIQSVPTNANNQDVNPMGTIAARKASRALDHLDRILAIEAMVLVSAMELRQAEAQARAFSGRARAVQQYVRQRVSPLGEDRPLGQEIENLSRQLYRQNWTSS